MTLFIVPVTLFAFLAVISGWGPEFFGGCGLVGAIAGFRRRRDRWWGLAAAAGSLAAGATVLAGWVFRTVWPTAVAVFVVVALLWIIGHRRTGRPAVRTAAPSPRRAQAGN